MRPGAGDGRGEGGRAADPVCGKQPRLTSRGKEAGERPVQFRAGLRPTLPDHRASPAGLPEQPNGLAVPAHVPQQLPRSVVDMVFGTLARLQFRCECQKQPFTKSAVCHLAREHQVRLARQIRAMEPEAQAQDVRRSSHVHLGGRVLGFHLRHRPGAMGRVLLCFP
jgi:hypothetical protein